MNTENIYRLADHLEKMEKAGERHFAGDCDLFDMGVWCDTTGCGTVGCIAGHACVLFDGKMSRKDSFRARELLGISHDVAIDLFFPGDDVGEIATGAHAAAMLRTIAETPEITGDQVDSLWREYVGLEADDA